MPLILFAFFLAGFGFFIYFMKKTKKPAPTTTVLAVKPESLSEFQGLKEPVKGKTVYPNGDPKKTAIIVGINKCSPYVYQGSDLRLRGCVNDAASIRAFLVQKGFGTVYYLTDETATIGNFLKVWKEVAASVKDGDTLFLSMSRHGMSLGRDYLDKDTETQGRNPEDGTYYQGDQGAVMHDGVIVDDCFWRLFLDLPKVKLVYWNDSCHSATQYRVANILNPSKQGAYSAIPRSVGDEYAPERNRFLLLTKLEAAFGKPKNNELQCSLVSLAGCQDVEYSADAYINRKFQGAFTWAGLSILSANPKINPKDFGKEVSKLLKTRGYTQNPQVNTEGDQTHSIL